jgi:broad specificity phosphatase PhoE
MTPHDDVHTAIHDETEQEQMSPTHRTTLKTIITVITLAASAILAACATSTGPTPGGGTPILRPAPGVPATADSPHSLIMIIRHGEKPDGSNPGVDSTGNRDKNSLTGVGWNRAHRLVDLFAPTQGSPRPGLARPTAIYAAGASDNGDGERTRETVQPLAHGLGIPVNTDYGKGDERTLVADVTARPGTTLISWQHGEIPAIVAAFPSVTPAPPAQWPDDRFDVVWTLTKTADGWHFAQVPELLLPQDRAGVIAQ